MSASLSTQPSGQSPRDGLANLIWAASALRRGWRLIAVSVAVCLTLAILYLAGAQRMYQATARLLVLQQGGRPLNMSNADPSRLMEGAEDYIPTHSQILVSPLVIQRAIDVIGLDHLPTLLNASRAGGDPLTTVLNQLKVTRPDRLAKIVRIDYSSLSPEESERMLRAVIESYERFLEDTFQKKSTEVVGLIGRARDDLSKELKDLEETYLDLRRKSLVTTLDETGRTAATRRVEQWERAANSSSIKAFELKSQLDLGRAMAREGTELWAIAHALGQVGSESASLNAAVSTGGMLAGPSDYIRQLSQEQHEVAEKFGPDYAKVRQLQEQISRAQERAREARGRLQRGEVKDLIDSLERSLSTVGSLRDDLLKRVELEQERSKQDEVALLAESTLRGKLERQRALFNTVVDQLKQAQFVSDFNSISAQAIEPAVALRKPVRPMITLTLAMALFCGISAGSAAAIAMDLRDPLVRSLHELRSILGLSMLGQIPRDRRPPNASNGEFGRICHDLPRSIYAEAFRATRTNLDLLRRRLNFQVLLISSPHAGDGKSSVASNVAISMACAGRSVLLIDADLRKPRQHRIHNVSRGVGLIQVLRDSLPISEVARPSGIVGLDVIVAGPETSNPAELLASPRLAEALAEARESYNFVIIDSPPLLAVTDSTILGAVADGVVLVTRGNNMKHGEAERIREVLDGLGTTLLGVLANAVSGGPDGYGYGYGSDREADPASAEPQVQGIVDRPDPAPGEARNGHSVSNGTTL